MRRDYLYPETMIDARWTLHRAKLLSLTVGKMCLRCCQVSFVVKESKLNGRVQRPASDALTELSAIILAVPYGTLADRIGRKKIFLLAIVGIGMNDLWMRMICK
jgi:hypothetical protein